MKRQPNNIIRKQLKTALLAILTLATIDLFAQGINLDESHRDYDSLTRNTLNFDEPFGTRAWHEDGLSWRWDRTGWDNIRTHHPHTGSGHGASAAGYHSGLSASSPINIYGIWLKTDFASKFSHLNLKGFDGSGNLMYKQALNPSDYEEYKYAELDWEHVESFAVDYDAIKKDTLNFDEPFGTRAWHEDGLFWRWDGTGWDNIRTYRPHTGSGHGMSAPGYHSRLSTHFPIDIHGIWLKTDFASNFSHLKLKGFDYSGELMYTQTLNPSDYEEYKYAELNWEHVESFAVDYDVVTKDTLNFDEPFATRAWHEDGFFWSWDSTGWDNIRPYRPHTGSGHGMSAAGNHSKLSTNSPINIHGIWLETDFSSDFSHLKLKGFDHSGNLMYTQALNPSDYEEYKYVELDWEYVESFAVDYDVIKKDTLNFDEPSSTRDWYEDRLSWSWDSTGWDNIRTYHPHTGSGHGMSTPGNHAKLSTYFPIDIHGIWLKTDFASNFSHLKLKGFGYSGNLMYTKTLNPSDYEEYKYVELDWKHVESFAVDYDLIDSNVPIVLLYDDLVYSSSFPHKHVNLYYDDLVYSSSFPHKHVNLYYDDLVYSTSYHHESPSLYYDDLVYAPVHHTADTTSSYKNWEPFNTSNFNPHTTEEEITFFPNPAQHFIQVYGLAHEENYRLYDILGVEVKSGTIPDNGKINTQNLDNGLYLLKFGNGKTIKFTKE